MAKDLFAGIDKTIKDLEEGTLQIPEELRPLLERAVASQNERKELSPQEIEEWLNRMTDFIVGD